MQTSGSDFTTPLNALASGQEYGKEKNYEVTESAKILGKAPFTVRKMCNKNMIPATKKGREWYIPAEVVDFISRGKPNKMMVELLRKGVYSPENR